MSDNHNFDMQLSHPKPYTTLTVNFPTSEYLQLRDLAAKKKVKLSEFIRDHVRKLLK